MALECLFCSIARGEIPADKVYEDERALVFRDISPQAPVHLLAIPKEHIRSIAQLDEGNSELAAHLLAVIARVAREQGLDGGYRVVSNCGADAQQSVNHLHFHILGGRAMTWPPG